MKIGAIAIAIAFCAPMVASAQYSHPMPQNPLTLAAYDARRKCDVVALEQSLDYCGTSMTASSPAHSAARRAVLAVYRARGAFMEECDRPYGLDNCRAIANAMMDEGIGRALAGQ